MKRVLPLLLALVMLMSIVPVYSAAAEEPTTQTQPKVYRWTVSDNRLVSDAQSGVTQNEPTMLTGSIKDGVLSGARFRLEKPISLRHDQAWSIEWHSKGNWDGMLLSSTLETPVDGLNYLFRYSGMNFLAFGEYTGSWNNYGMILNLNVAEPHTFRLENRIAPDGTNTVCLLVDGQEMGSMNQYYIAGTSQNKNVNWAKGKDLAFPILELPPTL